MNKVYYFLWNIAKILPAPSNIAFTRVVTLKMKVDICVRVHFKSFTIACRWGWTLSLSSECKIDQADFADRMFFLSSNLTKEISPKRKYLTRGMTEKTKTIQTWMRQFSHAKYLTSLFIWIKYNHIRKLMF